MGCLKPASGDMVLPFKPKGFNAMMTNRMTPWVLLGLWVVAGCGAASGEPRSSAGGEREGPLAQADGLREEGMKEEGDGNTDGALEYYLSADEQYTKVGNKKNENWGLVNFYAGLIYRQKQDTQHALDRFTKAYEVLKVALGPDHPRVAEVLNYKGAAHKDLHQMDEAVDCFKKALEIREKESPPDENQIRILKMNLSDMREGW